MEIGIRELRGLSHKTFYGRNLRIFVNKSTLEWNTSKVPHSGRLWPYPQTLK
jgi:hypothetical protein